MTARGEEGIAELAEIRVFDKPLDGTVQLVDDRPPCAAVEGQSVQKDDQRAGPLDVVGQIGFQVSRGCNGAPPRKVSLVDGGLIQEA